TNAINLIDNMDGLASGVVMVSALTMALYGLNHGLAAPHSPPAGTRLALLIAGTGGGFLIYNFNPAKLFMGDCGSLPLGFLISAAFGLLALASEQLSPAATMVLAALMFGALALFGAFLGRVQVYTTNTGRPEPFEGRGTLLGGTLLYKRQAAQLLLDVGLIPVALIGANLLRFEGSIPRP